MGDHILEGASSARVGTRTSVLSQLSPLIHLIAVLALLLRIAVALYSERTISADDIYQYLEPAHRLVYGYGVVPWEYRFGVRNWLLPGTLAAVLEVMRLCGLDEPRTYVPAMKLVCVTISVSMVYATAIIAFRLFGRTAALWAAGATAVWFELLTVSTASTPEVFGSYALVWALALTLDAPRNGWWIGILVGLAACLRLQYAVPAASIWAILLLTHPRRLGVEAAVSGSLVFVACGLLDWWTWGYPFVSFYNNFYYNIVEGVSTLFGTEPWHYYLRTLARTSMGVYAVALGFGLVHFRRAWPVVCIIGAVLLPHSLIAHKEYRFVILVAPLCMVLIGGLIAWIADGARDRRVSRLAGAVLPAAFLAVTLYKAATWTTFIRDDRYRIALELSEAPDVKAVLDTTGGWWYSGGYFYLHRDVPIYEGSDFPPDQYGVYASHVVAEVGSPVPLGFAALKTVGRMYYAVRVDNAAPVKPMGLDSRNPTQPGVENRLKPYVKPRY